MVHILSQHILISSQQLINILLLYIWLFCFVPITVISQPQFIFISKGAQYTAPGYWWCTSTALPNHTQSLQTGS